MPALPAGLTPVTAGRLGLWLLGNRSSARAKRRIAFPQHAPARSLGLRVARLLAPWRVYEYPGGAVLVAAICGVARETAHSWLYRGKAIPAKHRERLAVYLEDCAALMVAAAAELRAGTGTAARRIDESIAVRQDGTVAIKILTNGANGGPAPFAQAEPTQGQVKPEIFNAGAASPPGPQTAKPSKKFGTQTSRKAKRKTRR